MLDKYNSNQIFLDAKYGLQRVYQVLDRENLDGLSFSEIINSTDVSPADLKFIELLQRDFTNIDKNINGNISKEEINTLISDLEQKGLTYQQLAILKEKQQQYSFGNKENSSSSDDILDNFNEVDLNKDGRVSSQEINTYKLKKEIEEKEKELKEFKASNISVFYTESSTTSDISSGADVK